MNCAFCQIIARTAPASFVHGDDLVCAFLDIAPINPGHLLVVPLEHHVSVATVPEATLGRMMQVARRLAVGLMREVKADGFNLHLANAACAGQTVLHAHLHVIPRFPTDGFSWGWRSLDYGSDAARDQMAAALRERLAAMEGR